MARFDVRAEAQDGSGHFRVSGIEAESKDAAVAEMERREYRIAAFRLEPAVADAILAEAETVLGRKFKSLDELPKPGKRDGAAIDRAPFQALSAASRGRLVSHFQTKPYKVVAAKERRK